MFNKNKKNKKVILNCQGIAPVWIVLIVIFLIIIGLLIFLKLNPKEENQNNADSLNSPKDQNTQEQTKNNPVFPLLGIQEIQKNQSEKIDTDKDGLSDDKEKEVYKTDPNKTDTDGDGFSDWQEIVTYKTNPLKADTDGDGVNDKEEIQNMTNPNGEGNIESSGDSSSPMPLLMKAPVSEQ